MVPKLTKLHICHGQKNEAQLLFKIIIFEYRISAFYAQSSTLEKKNKALNNYGKKNKKIIHLPKFSSNLTYIDKLSVLV
jgi:hypothetical protein